MELGSSRNRRVLAHVWVALTAGAATISACSDTIEYGVALEFTPTDLSERIDTIQLSIVSSCFSATALGQEPLNPLAETTLRRGMELRGFGDIEEGQYNLYARGIGPCVAAAGCEPVEFTPGGDSVFVVSLHEIPASKYDLSLQDNGGCGQHGSCREQDGAAVCDCEQGYEFDGTTCTTPSGANETYISEWRWAAEIVEFGLAERNRSIGTSMHGTGVPMRIRGTPYDKGVGVNAPSELRINLDGRCSRFRAVVGIDDEVAGMGEARAQVWVDGVNVFQSATMTGASAAEMIDVNVIGAYELRLVTEDLGAPENDHVDWAQARLICEGDWRGDGLFSYVSDWRWDDENNGSGPAERDESNGGTAEGDGVTITLAGEEYDRGIGVHAPSEIVLDLADNCRRFRADIGVDDEVTTGGSVRFQVWADDEMLFQSNPMTSDSATQKVNVDLVDRSNLRLVVTDGGDGTEGDHADWANAQLLCGTGWTGEPVDTYVSDWVWGLSESGYGPLERDVTNGSFEQGTSAPIRIDGVTYERGVGAHAPSRLWLNLGRRCTRFLADVGIDDDALPGGTGGVGGDVRFLVIADGTTIFSGIKFTGDPADPVSVDVTNAALLQLEVEALGDDAGWDHADWANARLQCDPGAIGL